MKWPWQPSTEEERRQRFLRVFDHADGHAVLKDIGQAAGLHAPAAIYDGVAAVDANAAVYQKGQRDLVLWIIKHIGMEPLDLALSANEREQGDDHGQTAGEEEAVEPQDPFSAATKRAS